MQLLSLTDLSKTQLFELIRAAAAEASGGESVPDGAVALLFLEDSTRTRISFERASQKLGRPVINMDVAHSSLNKGESFCETLDVLLDYGVKTVVLRSREALFEASELPAEINLISAGQGTEYHPTQVMGDAAALLEYFGLESVEDLSTKRVLLCGDLRHSRVAHSWYELSKLLGMTLHLAAPKPWLPSWGEELRCFQSLGPAIEQSDILISLRVQKERHKQSEVDLSSYIRDFQANLANVQGRPVLHPGPTNWGVELAEEIQSYKKSLIRAQRIGCYRVRTELLRRF